MALLKKAAKNLTGKDSKFVAQVNDAYSRLKPNYFIYIVAPTKMVLHAYFPQKISMLTNLYSFKKTAPVWDTPSIVDDTVSTRTGISVKLDVPSKYLLRVNQSSHLRMYGRQNYLAT